MKRRVLKRIPLHFVFLWLTALALHPVQAEAIPPLPSNMLPLMFVENIGQVDGVERDENSANNTVEKDVIVYTFDTFVPVLLSPPDNGSVSDTTPTFRWQPIPGAVGYEIQYSRGDVATSETIATSTNSFTPAIPLLTTSYNWRVRGIGAGSTFTEWSNIASVTIASSNSAAPARGLLDTNTPTLTWGPVTWAAGYEVEVDNNSNFASPEFENSALGPNDLSVTTTPLPDGNYYWRVRARRENGTWGNWSKADSFIIRSH